MQHISHVARRRASIVAIAGIASISLVACSTAAGTGTTAAPNGDSTGAVIGISMQGQSNSFDQALQQILFDAATDAGFKPLEPTDAGSDPSQQIADIQSLVSRGAQAVIVTPFDGDALATAVDRVVEQGIPVVTPHVGVNTDKAYVNVRASGTQMGTLQCEAMKGQIPEDAQIFYEAGSLSDANGKDRWTSFSECVAKEMPGATVTMKESKWDPVAATDQIETEFGSGKKYDALILATDALYLSGALSTLEKFDLLKPVGDPDHIYLSTIDGSPEGLNAVRDGWQDFLVSQPVVQQGQLAVAYLKAAMDDEPVKAGPTDHDSEIIESENGTLTDFIPAIAVTTENVDDDLLWGNTVG